jgi:hypothetical protein
MQPRDGGSLGPPLANCREIMASRGGVKFLSLMLLILGGAAAGAGCQTVCTASCASPGSYLYTPTGLHAPLVDVTADPPCVAGLWSVDGGMAQVQVTDDTATQGAVCVLHGHLADGQAVAATVTFGQPTGGSCCSGFAPSGGEFTASDAGTDGG